eukprot:TRINITY_DN59603_c0_g1_i1.p4 TRINITY_DN59603_c0_g1~~TRINITY_DN59603_c0_g1_i1.p4  ORF type:complete len:105 (+),score=3.53 TRINITY_DN59603_c0_g1_i1:279-593(+)
MPTPYRPGPVRSSNVKRARRVEEDPVKIHLCTRALVYLDLIVRAPKPVGTTLERVTRAVPSLTPARALWAVRDGNGPPMVCEHGRRLAEQPVPEPLHGPSYAKH